MQRLASFALLATVSLLGSAAHAQSAQDKAAADALFDEAKRLVAAGDFEHACPKFEASLKLVVRVGAKLNLADCYEKDGRTASAWAEFREAAALATRSNDEERRAFATQRASALEPYLAKLTIKVAERVPGLTITRDGALVADVSYDTAIPIDPGEHTIQASADGFQPWSQKISVVREKTHTVEVPRLAPEPKKEHPDLTGPNLAVNDDDAVRQRAHGRKVMGVVVGVVGLAAAGAGVALGFIAKSNWQDAHDNHCNAQDQCDPTGVSQVGDARSLGTIATVTTIAGGVALAAGVVIYLTAPRPHDHAVSIAPVVGPGMAGFAIGGAF